MSYTYPARNLPVRYDRRSAPDPQMSPCICSPERASWQFLILLLVHPRVDLSWLEFTFIDVKIVKSSVTKGLSAFSIADIYINKNKKHEVYQAL